MFCPNCGKQISDESSFCGVCGTNLSERKKSLSGKNDIGEFTSEISKEIKNSYPEFKQPRKKNKFIKIVGVLAVFIVVIAAAMFLKYYFFDLRDDNAYVYLSNGKYELITNLKKNEPIDIDSSMTYGENMNLVSFSPDGTYVYYYTKYESFSETGSLCKAEYSKLKKNSKKNNNNNYIEVIATNVKLGFQFLDDGTVIYKNGDDSLYSYDGENINQISKSVSQYFTDGSNRIVYEVKNQDNECILYGVSLDDMDNTIQLASNYNRLLNIHFDNKDFDNIFYTTFDEKEYSTSLYVVGFEKASEKLGDNVSILNYTNKSGAVYFTAENGSTLNLYDFVSDSYAESDKLASKPDWNNYLVPSYAYDMIMSSNISESDYGELYTSCTKPLYWYGENHPKSYSMEEALSHNWGEGSDEICKATQDFIDKYADSADENGLILVTEDVKAALKEINKYDDDWKWMWLCYYKYPSGNTTDYEGYNNDVDAWYEIQNRVELRESLKDEENDYPVKTLYCYDNGTLTALSNNIVSTFSSTDVVVYNTTDLITDKVDIDNITSIYDLDNVFSIDHEKQNYLLLFEDAQIAQMSENAAQKFAESFKDNTYRWLIRAEGLNVYVNQEKGTFLAGTIKDGIIENFDIIDDDADIQVVDSDGVYYTSKQHTRNDIDYCNLNLYSEGTSKCLAQDIILNDSRLYSDEVILAYTGSTDGASYELTMFDADGNPNIIADNVTQYIRVDKSTLLYISDGRLYNYNGKEKNIICRNVDMLWSLHMMDVCYRFYKFDQR